MAAACWWSVSDESFFLLSVSVFAFWVVFSKRFQIVSVEIISFACQNSKSWIHVFLVSFRFLIFWTIWNECCVFVVWNGHCLHSRRGYGFLFCTSNSHWWQVCPIEEMCDAQGGFRVLVPPRVRHNFIGQQCVSV